MINVCDEPLSHTAPIVDIGHVKLVDIRHVRRKLAKVIERGYTDDMQRLLALLTITIPNLEDRRAVLNKIDSDVVCGPLLRVAVSYMGSYNLYNPAESEAEARGKVITMVEQLIHAGADIECRPPGDESILLRRRDYINKPPLALAAEIGDEYIVRKLLELRANVNSTYFDVEEGEEESALDLAVICRNWAVAQVLLNAGACFAGELAAAAAPAAAVVASQPEGRGASAAMSYDQFINFLDSRRRSLSMRRGEIRSPSPNHESIGPVSYEEIPPPQTPIYKAALRAGMEARDAVRFGAPAAPSLASVPTFSFAPVSTSSDESSEASAMRPF